MPHFPVICPGATRWRAICFFYNGGVQMRSAELVDHPRPFPAPVDTAQGRCKERSMCRWEPCESASSLAARTLLRICFKNNDRTAKFLVVHATSGLEA